MPNDAIGPRGPRIQIPGDLRVCGALSPRIASPFGANTQSVALSSTLSVGSLLNTLFTLTPNQGILLEYADGTLGFNDASGQLAIQNMFMSIVIGTPAFTFSLIVPSYQLIIAAAMAAIAGVNLFAITPYFVSYDDIFRFAAVNSTPFTTGTPITISLQLSGVVKNNDGAAAHSIQSTIRAFVRQVFEVVEIG